MIKHTCIFIEKQESIEESRIYHWQVLLIFCGESEKRGIHYSKWLECKKCGKVKNAREWGTQFLGFDSGGSDMIYEIPEEKSIPITSMKRLNKFRDNKIEQDSIEQDSDEKK